jgi:protein-S-isoprenylcysteine O-methyltransferase Ste14
MHHYAIKIINMILLVSWGFAEMYWNIHVLKRNPEGQVSNKESKVYLQASFSLACFVAMPLVFLNIGDIQCCFPYITAAGFILTVIGLIIRFIAVMALSKQFSTDVRIVKGHELVTTGIFKYIRHPSYLGYLIIPVGIGIAFSNWIAMILFSIPNIFAVAYRIRVEEKVLTESFGQEYLDYKKRTKMLIPWLF